MVDPGGRRAIVHGVNGSDQGRRGDWIEELEPDQVAAFRAFQRVPTKADHGLENDPSAVSALSPSMNTNLARRAYAGPEGTIDLVPGPGTIGCVVTVADTGERMSGTTTTELAACGAHGFTSTSFRHGRSAAFRGVLAARVVDLRIITAHGETMTAPVNADDAYWVTVSDPVEAILTLADGSKHEIPVPRPAEFEHRRKQL